VKPVDFDRLIEVISAIGLAWVVTQTDEHRQDVKIRD